jgi:hypothetical protein
MVLLENEYSPPRSYPSDLKELAKQTDGSLCCCCICYGTNQKTRDMTCLGCLPITCGIKAIAYLAIFMTFCHFMEAMGLSQYY